MGGHTLEARLNLLGATLVMVCFGYLVLRVFTGIDFTDEMQHYGELASMVTTGKLFQADLFLQQAMYVFLYPVFRLYYLAVGGWDYLVVAGRVFMLLAYVAAAWLVYRRSVSGSARYPGWIAASVLLVWLPFNILSPYYNAIACLLISLILFCWTGESRNRAYLIVSTLAVSMLCVTYPTLGLVVGAVLVGDELLMRRYSLALRMTAFLAVFGIMWGAILLSMTAGWADIRDALAFSKSFDVGYAFSHPRHLFILLVIVLVGMTFSYLGAKQEKTNAILRGRVALLILLLSAMWLAQQRGWFMVAMLYLGSLFLLRYVSTAVPEKKQVARLGVFGLLIGAVSALTSGNGVINIALGVGATLPYLVGLLLKGGVTSDNNVNETAYTLRPPHLAMFVGILLVANNVLHPYRDEPVWKLDYSLDSVPAFRGITGSEEKRVAVELLQGLIDSPDMLSGKTLLVVGPQPWAYFALMAVPRTPMLFMHYSGGTVATRIVADRLSHQVRPDFILFMSQPPAEIMAALNRVLDSGYMCEMVAPNIPVGVTGKTMEKYGLGSEMKMCRLGA